MDSKYLIGISELDSQHEEIESAFSEYQEAIKDKARASEMPGIIANLREKVRFHFHAEESIMRIFAYPETEEHRRFHLEILKSIERLGHDTSVSVETQDANDQAMRLFLEQILSQDMRFAAFLQRSKTRLGIPV